MLIFLCGILVKFSVLCCTDKVVNLFSKQNKVVNFCGIFVKFVFVGVVDIKVRGAGCLSVRAAMSASGKASSQAVERVVVDNEEGQRGVEILRSVNDDHGGVIVELVEPMDAAVYGSSLRASISHWKQQVFNHCSYQLLSKYLLCFHS